MIISTLINQPETYMPTFRKYLIALILLTQFQQAFSQNQITVDTTKANNLYSEFYGKVKSNEFTTVIKLLEEAKSLYAKHNLTEKAYIVEYDISYNYLMKGDAKTSKERSEVLLEASKREFGDSSLVAGYAAFVLANAYQGLKEPENSLKYQFYCVDVFSKYSTKKARSYLHYTYANISNIYLMLGDHEKAIAYNNKVDPKNFFGTYYYEAVARIAYNTGLIYHELGFHDQTVEKMQESMEFLKKGDRPASQFPVYNSILIVTGGVKLDIGEYVIAKEYLHKAKNNIIRIYGKNSRRLVSVYGYLAKACRMLEEYDSAIYYNNKSIEGHNLHFNTANTNLAYNYEGMASSYLSLKDYDNAIKYCEKAISVFEEMNSDNVKLAESYAKLGQVYLEANNLEMATYFAKKAENTLNYDLKSPRPDMALVFLRLSEIKLKNKDFVGAIFDINRSLASNVESFPFKSIYDNPPREGYFDQLSYLRAMILRAEAFKEKYINEGKDDDLIESAKTFMVCDSALHIVRNRLQMQEDQLKLQEIFSDLYSKGSEVLKLAGNKLNKAYYDNALFSFIESGKASILSSNIYSNQVKSIRDIPNEIVLAERETSTKLEKYRQKLLDIQYGELTQNDSLQLGVFKTKINDLRYKYDSIEHVIHKHYPKYYAEKFKRNILDLNSVQKRIADNEAIIEYQVGDSIINVVLITSDDYNFIELSKPKNFVNQIENLRSSLAGGAVSNSVVSSFKKSAGFLGNQLLSEVIERLKSNKEITHLTIIPEDILFYVPFEILLVGDKYSTIDNYKSLPYLLKDYSVSYGFSASLNKEDKQGYRSSFKGYIGYAPSYTSLIADNTASNDFGEFRDQITELKWNQKEVEEIADLFEGTPFTAANATETNFKEQLNDYSIMHLAMHAIVDDKDPLNSNLVFSTSNDTINDGLLHTYEIFNLDINPELVVLSACNTGFGKLQKGEGISSLAYAFKYAGSPSIIMSHWAVNDYSTKEIMLNFYKYMKEGYSKDESLRMAKLEFLNNADENLANPAYWSAFVILGNSEAIELNPISIYTYILVAVAVLGLLSLIYFVAIKRRGVKAQ